MEERQKAAVSKESSQEEPESEYVMIILLFLYEKF